jgi:hypothetical protein
MVQFGFLTNLMPGSIIFHYIELICSVIKQILAMKKMFLTKFLFLLLLALSFTSCKKEKSDPGKLLIGRWTQVSTLAITYYDNVKTNEITNTYAPNEYVLEVLSDGTAIRYYNGKIASSYYWSIEGDLLLITWDSGVVQKTEYSVNDTSLTLRWAVEDTSDGHTIRSEYESIYSRL